jgi:GxxExxY protein
MNADERRLNEITERVIGCAYAVSNGLGCGFLEKVYENAMMVEMAASGLKAVQQHAIKVIYRGAIVGEYVADLLVEDCILVELKAVKSLDDIFMAQCLNYLKATGIRVCLLINFATPRIEIRRIVNKF